MKNSKVTRERKTVPVASLREFPGNPNIHPEDQIKAIAASIEKYGQYYPIIVDEDMQILCGHGKKKAIEYRGEATAEVIIMRGLTEKEKMKLIIEDNKIQTMSYSDFGKIEAIIRQIGDTDIIGFPEHYLDAVINEVVKDNMGVDFAQPMQKKSSEQQIADIPQEQRDAADEEYSSIDGGMQSARTIRCPHCGTEITL